MLENSYIDKDHIETYFPEPPDKVDRSFFWSIWLKVESIKAENYIQ